MGFFLDVSGGNYVDVGSLDVSLYPCVLISLRQSLEQANRPQRFE